MLLPTHPYLLLIIKVVKVISCLVIAGAIGLTVGKLNGMIPSNSWLETLCWLGRMALLLHLVEAIAAMVLADRVNLNPLKAGIYTFWMGAAGIAELLLQIQAREHTPS